MLHARELRRAHERAYLEALRYSHEIDIRVRVHDKNEDLKHELDGRVVGGQVDGDSTSEITRSLAIDLEDPRRQFTFAQMGKVYADNFINVLYRVWVSDLNDWVQSSIFFGPVSHFERDGTSISIEAVGKETLLLPPIKHTPLGSPTNRQVSAYIREAAFRFGERKFNLGAARGVKVPKSFNIEPKKARENGVWWYLQKLAQSAGFRLFYDGRGYLTLKRYRKFAHHVFLDPLSEPVVGYDLQDFRNQIRVFGEDDKGRRSLRAIATLKASHPLSPQNLARNGVPRYLVEDLTFDTMRFKNEDATLIAKNQLDRRARQVVDVQFDHLVVPHVELGDTVRLKTENVNVAFPLRQMTIPLTATETMSVGYTKAQRLSKFRARVRRIKR